MFCTQCQSELPDCTCDDRDERLRALGNHESFVTSRCLKCAENRVNCECNTYVPANSERSTNDGRMTWADMPAKEYEDAYKVEDMADNVADEHGVEGVWEL